MIRFVWSMFWRESRFSWKRQVFFVFCIAVGVGGLVAVKSFSYGIESKMRDEARNLMAADLILTSNRPFVAAERAALAELESEGAAITLSREFVSMAMAPATGDTRMVDVRAVGDGYPFYGEVLTASGRPFRELLQPGSVLVHSSILIHLGLQIGDTLRIGSADFRIGGELIREPDTVSMFSFAPRVLMTDAGGEATGLIRPDGLVRYRAMVKLPPDADSPTVAAALREKLPDRFARVRTYDAAQPRVSRFMGNLTDYLNLVGLVALMLGGVGVAAAIRVFLAQKVETIAVLKCLGATSGLVLAIYLLQALLLGLTGSGVGIALGLMLQGVLPHLLKGLIPVQMEFSISWAAAGEGLLLGGLITLLFTLPPILQLRRVPPARIFRRNVEADRGQRFELWWSLGVVLPVLLALSVWQGGSWKIGGIFFAGLAGAIAALYLATRGFLFLLRRMPKPRRFVIKYGLMGLYRPGNQAVPVSIALGLGVMLVLLIYLTQNGLLRQIVSNSDEGQPNLIFIDIQKAQLEPFGEIMAQHGLPRDGLIPIVRGRVRALNGDRIRLDEITDEDKRRVLGFTYAFTYRDRLEPGEEVLEGRFGPDPERSGHQVSIADWWSEYSGVGLGDTVTVDIQGVPITATVTSIRKVDWGNRRANFSLVFMPGALEEAPHMYVATLQVPGAAARVAVQKAVVSRLPNVTVIDVEIILQSVQQIVDRIALVIQFMAAFSVVVGVVILIGAVATTKYQRLREVVLLKTLGATRAVVAAVLAIEYVFLGGLAGLVGAVAAGVVSWGMVTFVFRGSWDFSAQPYLIALTAATLMTLTVGVTASLDILSRKPLQVLREE